MDLPIEISPRAWREIKYIVEKKNIPAEYGLRVTVQGRGCAGVAYNLGFDKEKDGDLKYDADGLQVYIRKGELMYLIGKRIDFYEGADARGFLFEDQPDNSTVAR